MSTVTSDGNYSVDVPDTNAAVDRDRFGTLINTILNTLPTWMRTRVDSLDFAGFELSDSVLVDYAEKRQTPSISTNVLTLDIANGNHATITMDQNITTLTINNPSTSGDVCMLRLSLVQDGTGSRTITWPSAIKWPGGTAPVLTTTASRQDEFVLITEDAGTTWTASVRGLNYTV
jgi:hypothetical protein